MPEEVTLRYAPSPPQLAFHQDRGSHNERGGLAGTGGGKTYMGLFEVLDWTLSDPGSPRGYTNGTVLAAWPTVPMWKKALPDTWRMMTGHPLGGKHPLVADWTATDRHLVLRNGWQVWFVTVENPTNIEGPPQVDLVWLDEARVVRNFAGEDGAWQQLTRRLRGGSGQDRPRGAILTTHSPSREIMEVFHPTSVQRYRAPGPGGVGRFEVSDCRATPGITRRSYQWGTQDAAVWRTISEKDAERIAGAYTGAARDRVVLGRYAKATGIVYTAYDEARNLHEIPATLRQEGLVGGIDWGFDVVALDLLANTGSRRWLIREDHLEGATLPKVAAAIKRLDPGGVATWWGGHDRPDSAKELSDEYGLDVRPVPTHRVEDGIEILQNAFTRSELFVDPKCKGFRFDLDNYVRGKDGAPDKQAHDAHHADAVRYAIMGDRGGVRGGITW